VSVAALLLLMFGLLLMMLLLALLPLLLLLLERLQLLHKTLLLLQSLHWLQLLLLLPHLCLLGLGCRGSGVKLLLFNPGNPSLLFLFTPPHFSLPPATLLVCRFQAGLGTLGMVVYGRQEKLKCSK
jgi:hypothetical protein